MRLTTGTKTLSILAIVLTALALVPAGAHLFELPNKIGLPRESYFTVQNIYRGWQLFAFVLIPAVLVDAWLAVSLRADTLRFSLALAGTLCIASTLVVFFVWVFPGNQATANWTIVPPDWEQLRSNWEYGHAASAVLNFLALCLVTTAAVFDR